MVPYDKLNTNFKLKKCGFQQDHLILSAVPTPLIDCKIKRRAHKIADRHRHQINVETSLYLVHLRQHSILLCTSREVNAMFIEFIVICVDNDFSALIFGH